MRTNVLLSVLLATALACAALLPSCRSPQTPAPGKTRVLCSVYPVYLFTRTLAAGTSLQVEPMLPASLGCPHDYALTPEDMHKLAAADILVINGAGLEEFMGEPVRKANPKVQVIEAARGVKDPIRLDDQDEHDDHEAKAPAATAPVTAKAEPKKDEPGACPHCDHSHAHGGVNPHLFASPETASQMVHFIAAELARLVPADADRIRANAGALVKDLEALADEFAAAVKQFRSRKIVTEHAVFDYLARDSGLEIVAVIEEAPGQAPSAARMLEIIGKIKASGAAAVFTEPQYPAKVGQTIAKEAGVPVASLDPVATGPAEAGAEYYLQTMRANLRTLTGVLGGPAR